MSWRSILKKRRTSRRKTFAARLLRLYKRARALERAEKFDRACAFYAWILAAATSKTSERTDLSDSTLATLRNPPVQLVASNAAVKLGLLIDPAKLDESREHFLEGLRWWPSNGMAHLNLGDLERENGSLSRALSHYSAAAALPPAKASCSTMVKWLVDQRQESVRLASYMCALLHHANAAPNAALPYLHRFPALRYRLSGAIWQLASRHGSSMARPRKHKAANSPEAVRRFDGCVPPLLLDALRRGFSVSAPFWKETDYHRRGYYSFWYDVSCPPSNVVEVLCRHLLPLTGVADRVVGCEWWVHSRPEGRSTGHQFHFDTEEVWLSRGKVFNPLVSSVTYLSGSSTADPTVVLEQRVVDKDGSAAFVSHPKVSSTLFFPGDRLHCVAPSKAPSDGSTDTSAASALVAAVEQPQRVTLMVGFWGVPVHAACHRNLYDACGPMPRPKPPKRTWPAKIAVDADELNALHAASEEALRTTQCCEVASIDGKPWERIPSPQQHDDWTSLAVPEGRNHRFFVSSPRECSEQIFNPPPIDG